MTVMRQLLTSCFPFVALWFFFSEESPYAKYRLQGENHPPEMHARNIVPHAHRAKDNFSWESITPTEELIWTDCYSNQHCARLKVPLDYAQPDVPLLPLRLYGPRRLYLTTRPAIVVPSSSIQAVPAGRGWKWSYGPAHCSPQLLATNSIS
ncbi:hypothetical protein B0H12DRAFT_218498 [Mycena haematopus]|nr:hypothetical protein B0H12DRAFT_218498 [Mycena haematopus]